MRFLGFTFSFKRESRWVPREEFTHMSQVVYALSQDTTSALNGVAAGKKRMDRHLGKEEGEAPPVTTPPPAKERPNLSSLGPGDIVSPETIRALEGDGHGL